jgi:hypothetical protein
MGEFHNLFNYSKKMTAKLLRMLPMVQLAGFE